MTFLALEASLTDRWPTIEFRRLASIRRETNSKSDEVLLALSAHTGVRPRREDGGNQLPSVETITKYWVAYPGDLVFNPMWALEGGVAVTELRGALSTAYRVYKLGPRLHPRFAHYFLRSSVAIDQYNLLVRGVTTFDRAVKREDFEPMPMPVPPIEEQRTIAEYLDTETGRIDSLIEKKQRMIGLLRKQWRTNAVNVMRELASHYGTIQLRRLVKCLDGKRVPLSGEERSSRVGPFPYFGASQIVGWVDDYLFDETLVLLGEDGAQLGDPNAEISQVVTGKTWVNNHAHVLRPTGVDPEFLSIFLNVFDRNEFISGGTREKITQDDMNRIPVPNLSPEVQRQEGIRVANVRRHADQVSARLRQQILLLQERRRALITAAVTGQLDLSEVAA